MLYPVGVKRDVMALFFLVAIACIIFYPLLYSKYAYTDELVGLWFNSKDHSYNSVLSHGRYITQKLSDWLYGSINTINDLTFLRLFSLAGWLVSIPVWYFIIKKVTAKEKIPRIFAFLSTLYLVCSTQVSISAGWAACFMLPLANSTGLISGYLLYKSIRNENGKASVSAPGFIASLIVGIISLFTYQSGFGCFLLPFLLHLVSREKSTRTLLMGFGGFAVICIVYFLLYKLSLQVNHVGQNERTAIYFNPIGKLKFLFTRAVSSSFHFNYIFNEKSIPGLIVYSILFIAWIIAVFTRQKTAPFLQRIKYLLIIFLFFVLIYFPSLIVKENFASNRTLFALNMAVFFVVVYEVLKLLFTKKRQTIFVLLLSLFFIVNAWYNFNKLFLQPVKKEYTALSTFMLANYRNEIHTVYFIQPEEDFFVRKYGITRSWDEFGVPSSFFGWVPEFLVKQLVFEKTGDRSLADKIVVQHWIGQSGYKQSGVKTGEGILLVDAENILTND